MLDKLTVLAKQALERGHHPSISVQPSGYWTITISAFFENNLVSSFHLCSHDENAEWRLDTLIERGYWK